MKELNLAGPDGPCYRTKCQCLRMCIDGPIAVVYPQGAWYKQVTPGKRGADHSGALDRRANRRGFVLRT